MLEPLLAAGMRFTTVFLLRGLQALALAFEAGFDFCSLSSTGGPFREVRRDWPCWRLFFTSDVVWVTFIRNILQPQNGAEQGEDAQQREERCH
jgi:hypothetical protein